LGEYADLRRSLRREIAVVRSALSFLAVSMGAPSYGHQTGEVDDASLFKLRLDDDRIMQQSDSMSAPTIAVCVLIDESGSMWAQTRSGRARVHVARDVALTLVEGLKEVPGMSVSIYGHSAEMYDGKGEKQYGVLLYRYYTPSMPHAEKLIHAEARSQNLDGFAIQHAANLFAVEHRFSERKIMFVVSDGYPAGHGYGGSLARGHMKRVSDSCQNQLGVEVYGIGIDNAYEERKGSEMYGQGNSVTLKDVSSSLGVMVRFLRQTAITMRRKE
jgi:cobalamin biosynthesis protein CobT